MSSKEKAKSESPPYEPTAHERDILQKRADRRKDAAPVMRRVPHSRRVRPDHPHFGVALELMAEEMGVETVEGIQLLEQLAKLAKCGGKVDLGRFNSLISVVKSAKPTDAIEAQHVAQMAGIHVATMDAIQRMLACAHDPERFEVYERGANRLARTYALQMETLKRHRSTGVQQIVVQKVNVEQGGQAAFVSNVNHANAKPESERPSSPPPLTVTDAKQKPMPMPIIEELAATVVPRRWADE